MIGTLLGNQRPYYLRAQIAFALWAIVYALVWGLAFLYPEVEQDHEYLYRAAYWISQSALIGSIADWFAVTALFRKPLGIPYHTALLPRKKEELIQKIVQMVESFLLDKEKVRTELHKIPFFDLIDSFLLSPKGQTFIAKQASMGILTYLDKSFEKTLLQKGRQALGQVQVSPYILRYLEAQGFDKFLGMVKGFVRRPEVTAYFAQEIDAYLDRTEGINSFFIGLGRFFDAINSYEYSEALQGELLVYLEAAERKGTPQRTLLESQWLVLLASLGQGSEGAQRVESLYKNWLHELPLEHLWEEEISPLLEQWRMLDEEGQSRGGQKLGQIIHKIWLTYRTEPTFVERIQTISRSLVIDLLDPLHSMIGDIVYTVLHNFDDERFNRFFEDKIGEDLGFIRINGTFVGAILGFVLWFVTLVLDKVLLLF